jgi:hypothetical protein
MRVLAALACSPAGSLSLACRLTLTLSSSKDSELGNSKSLELSAKSAPRSSFGRVGALRYQSDYARYALPCSHLL